jgi:hypothetical protein
MEPPAFSMYPSADEFQNAAELCKSKVVNAIDDFFFALANEANGVAQTFISYSDRTTLLSTALHDSGLIADLEEEAESLSEESEGRSDYAEHNTMHRTAQGV